MGLRDAINQKPMLGWGLAAVLAVATAYFAYRGLTAGETRELTENVTIRCRETGKEWTMTRGAMEKQLYMRPYPLNPDEGLPNPDTGKPTGFPVDDWKKAIEEINAERKSFAEGGNQLSRPGADKRK